jgi:hypothetical protein
VPIVGTMVQDIICIYIVSLCLLSNIFLFPLSIAKLIGEFLAQKAKSGKLLSGAAILTLLKGEAQRIEKICGFLLLALRIRPASPLDAASALRFKNKRSVRHSTNKTSCGLYIALILLALHCSWRLTY